jgi:Ser/Thr protein kinase RdoA (MazF antagonist)
MNNHFPVTHSTLSINALMTDILPCYDIGTPVECRFLNQGLNDTYVVETKTDKYILRVYRAGWRSRSDILYEIDALLHLKQHNVSVSFPVPRKDGEILQTVTAPEGSRTIVLFSYAPGKEPAYEADEENESYQYGRSVAQIHSETDEFRSQHQRFHLDLDHLLDIPLKSIRPLILHRPDDWKYLYSLSERLRQHVADLPLSSLERGFCHGDFHGWNAHIGQDGALTFFDFDCCGFGWRAYDIAVFRWGARGSGKEKERWPHFLRGYREVRPIHEVDIQATSYFVAIRQFWLLGLHTSNGQDWGFGWMNDRYFDQAIKFFREWEAEQSDEKQIEVNVCAS